MDVGVTWDLGRDGEVGLRFKGSECLGGGWPGFWVEMQVCWGFRGVD